MGTPIVNIAGCVEVHKENAKNRNRLNAAHCYEKNIPVAVIINWLAPHPKPIAIIKNK